MSLESPLASTVSGIIRRVGKVPAERRIASESRLVDDLGIDSLDLVAVYLDIQDATGVIIEDEDIARLQTVGDVVAYVQARAGSAAA